MQPHSMAAPSNYVPGSGAGIRGGLPEEKNVFEIVKENTNVYARRFQGLLDRSTPHVAERWIVTGTLFILFSLSVVVRQGWYIIMCESLNCRSVADCQTPLQSTSSISSLRSCSQGLTQAWPMTSLRMMSRRVHPVSQDPNVLKRLASRAS